MGNSIQFFGFGTPFVIGGLCGQYGYPTGLAALELSKRTGKPNLISIQGGDGHWIGLCCATHKEAITTVFDHAGALLIGSKSFAGEVEAHHGTPLSRFTLVAGAGDATRFAPRPGVELGALRDPKGPILLYHGRVDRRKGALDLLDAFALLIQNPKWSEARVVYSGIGLPKRRIAVTIRRPHCLPALNLAMRFGARSHKKSRNCRPAISLLRPRVWATTSITCS